MDRYTKGFFKQQGKRGGEITKAKGTDYRALGRAGALKRWGVRKESRNPTPPPSEKAKSNLKLTQSEEEPDAEIG
jgi:hypothetical protein